MSGESGEAPIVQGLAIPCCGVWKFNSGIYCNFCTILQAIFFGGIDVSIRGEVWPFMLRYYSHESTSEEREALRVQKRREYFEIQQKR